MSCSHCNRGVLAKNLCQKHYMQVRRHGKVANTAYDRRPIETSTGIEYRFADGKVALFDSDFEPPKGAPTISDHGYVRFGNKYAHRMVMQPPSNLQVDHINSNKLDNRKSNLRLCTEYDNQKNKKKPINNVSGYIGVWWDSKVQKWASSVRKDGKSHWVGYYLSSVEAAKARDKLAIELHGDFAWLNFKSKEI